MEKFDLICRTCNTERSNLINLSSPAPGNEAITLGDVLLTVCPSVPIQDNDRLPRKICYFCSKQLEIAYKFQLQCKKSYDDLWTIIESTLKKEPAQPLSPVRNEDLQTNEDSEDKSCIVEEFEDCSATMSENLEFLEEDEDMGENDEEEISEVEASPQETVLSSTENAGPTVCCHCDTKFFTVKGLRLHERLAHKNLQPILTNAEILTIECKYCLQVFEKKSELTLHCSNEHKNELAKDLTCEICQKTFSGKNRYEHHLLYHAKSRFQCTVRDCTKTFIIKYKLTDHLKRFHGIALSASQTRALKPRIVEES